MKTEDGRYYTKEHEWLQPDGDNVYIGITDYAQSKLGGVVYVELPDTGTDYEAGNPLASLESVKAVAEVNMPVDGEVLEANESLEDEPEQLNDDPYNAWIACIHPETPLSEEDWMDAKEYQTFCEDL